MTCYVLITAAYNEGKYIDRTIRSVIAQTLRPLKWVIVSDGSTDRTDEIVNKYAAEYGFVQLYRITERHARNFGAQVNAITVGYDLVRDLKFDFFANLDADISFEPTYYEYLLKKFKADPKLGLAGGTIYEQREGRFQNRPSNNPQSVPHAVQMFRRECFDCIGGYVAMPYGGPDWVAEVMVRRLGWKVGTFPDLVAYHHRPTGGAGGRLKDFVRQGNLAYSIGSDPFFEFGKTIRRFKERPLIVGALVRLYTYLWASCTRKHRPVSNDFIRFLRAEQRIRMLAFLKRWCGFRSSPRY
ncbi:MAG: glycosyltransferase family A protein [Acidobacteriota bacterium]|nr:glycosyltransferase family A protein [Acidobacteriota bacterium]